MLTNNSAFKYETPYIISFEITKYWTNGTVTLKYGMAQNRNNINYVKPYESGTDIKDTTSGNDVWQCQHLNY